MSDDNKTITRKKLVQIFGLRSGLFINIIKTLRKRMDLHKDVFNEKYSNWEKKYKHIYGESINSDLFLKHTYFALILKVLILIKLSIIQNLDLEEAYDDFTSNNLEALQIFEYNLFDWTNLDKKSFSRIFTLFEQVSYARQDLFIDFYQQIFYSVTRHKIGEFYTPSNLVAKMVEHSYQMGFKVLDPACGSGNFLIEIILKILNSDISIEKKVEYIDNVYGFDINPLAVMTAKINLLLIYMDYFDVGEHLLPKLNIFIVDALFPEDYENQRYIQLNSLYHSFDLVIGNPPWLTYKDLTNSNYQERIKELASELGIKPSSQYITHIEIAAIFFYSVPTNFLKEEGSIFFVITKSILNGDHCYKFRRFFLFENIKIWDFPTNYFFNINHVCLMAKYIGPNDIPIKEKYPINARVYNDNLTNFEKTYYSSLKIEKEGTKLILPESKLKILNKVSNSIYRDQFYQGATLVPRSLIFFQVQKKKNDTLIVRSDEDVITRTKKRWKYTFSDIKLEKIFRYKTFLNRDLIPFLLKETRNIFLPINKERFSFNINYLKNFPYAYKFYNTVNDYYQKKKKKTSKIDTLFKNLNYWNKLLKQKDKNGYLVIYNASGSNLKAAVINNSKNKIIVGSENYYFNTFSKQEAYYLTGILNSPLLTKNIKLIKSSRHIHKRPFSFPIPIFEEDNDLHKALSTQGQKCESIVQDLFMKNSKINSDKVRLIINQKLNALNQYVERIVFTKSALG